MPHSADCPPEVYAALLDRSAGYTLAAYFPPVTLWPAPFSRPHLDSPSVAPPVRVFFRSGTASPRDGSGGTSSAAPGELR